MTREKFLKELTNYANRVKWTLLGEDKRIRTIDGLHCPISWVALCKGCSICDPEHPFSTASYLDLDSYDACLIVDAADGEDGEVAIRNQLLKAVNLSTSKGA